MRQSSKGDWHASWAAMRAYLQFDGQQNKSTLPLLSLATTPGYSLATALPCHYSRPIFLPFLFSPLPLLSLATTPGYSRGPHKSDPSVRLANKMAHPSAHVQAEVDHHSLVTILSALYAQDQRFASRTPRRSGHSLRICSKSVSLRHLATYSYSHLVIISNS